VGIWLRELKVSSSKTLEIVYKEAKNFTRSRQAAKTMDETCVSCDITKQGKKPTSFLILLGDLSTYCVILFHSSG
jgi:hypothetical protein